MYVRSLYAYTSACVYVSVYVCAHALFICLCATCLLVSLMLSSDYACVYRYANVCACACVSVSVFVLYERL